MDANFYAGERATLVNSKHLPQYDGRDVQIVETLGPRPMRDPDTREMRRVTCYLVITHDGRVIPARVSQLKKKRRRIRAIDRVVSWSECAFQPAAIRR